MPLLRPASPVTPASAELRLSGSTISVRFPEKRDDFRHLVKHLGYHWEWPWWVRQIPERAGNVQDRAAELGYRLLLAGFCVEFPDETLAQQAASGDYTAEQTRWVSRRIVGEYKDWFMIEWGRNEDFYARARRLRGSRYSPPGIVIPATYYEEVLDFAEAHDFRLSPGAQALAAEARARFEQAVIVAPAPRKNTTPKPPTEVAEIGIADELKDDPL